MSPPLPSAALKAQSSFVSDPRQLPTRPLEQVRERVIEALSEHFARDNISLDDLETRMARVYSATTPQEVDSLLDGLPALATGAPLPASLEPNAPAPKLRKRLVAIMLGAARTVPRVMRHRMPAEKPRRIPRARTPMRKAGLLGNASHDRGVGRFLKHDDVRLASADDRCERGFPAGPTVSNVVAQEPKSRGSHERASSSCSLSLASSSFVPSINLKYGWSSSTSRAYCRKLEVAWMFTSRPAILHNARRSGTSDGQ